MISHVISRDLETTLILKMASSSFGANTPELRTRYGRKRLKLKFQWKRKKMKLLKDSGKEYTTYTGALMPAKKLIDLSCKCKYHCQAKLRKSKAVYRLNSKSTYTEEER